MAEKCRRCGGDGKCPDCKGRGFVNGKECACSFASKPGAGKCTRCGGTGKEP